MALNDVIVPKENAQGKFAEIALAPADIGAAAASHTHDAAAITSGTLDNDRVNFAAPPAIGNTTPAAGTFTTLTANNGTLTASAPAGTFSQTWDDGAVFTASASGTTLTVTAVSSGTIRVGMLLYPSGFSGNERTIVALGTGNGGTGTYILSSASTLTTTWTGVINTFKTLIVDVASIAALRTASLFEARTNGASVFAVTRNGHVALGGEIDFTRNSSSLNRITSPNVTQLTIGASGGGSISMWGSGYGGQPFSLTNAQGAGFLFLGGANNIEMRNGTSPCGAFLLNNTFTSATNHERGFLRWSSNVFQIGTEKGSAGGTARALEIRTDNVARINIGAAGEIGFFGAAAAAQPAAVADATDAASTQDRLNDLLARLRTLGLIAT